MENVIVLQKKEIMMENVIVLQKNADTIREVGRLIVDSMNQQLELQREQYHRGQETTLEQFRQILNGQNQHNERETELLVTEMERMRLERETSRGMTTQRLPNFDGTNFEVDDWEV